MRIEWQRMPESQVLIDEAIVLLAIKGPCAVLTGAGPFDESDYRGT
jgi:hypothetical protein